jgi:superfamily I DNA/RNA helicase
MGQIIAVLGQAGTGKTTWLMRQASELAPRFLTAEHHALLAITRMHGSRRRLQMKLLEICPSIPCAVTTIDGFALSLLNRWRRSLGYVRPIQPVDGETDFSDTIFGTEAGFPHILNASTRLFGSETVKAIIRETYPLVMIDEFQDCHGPLLDFIKALSMCSVLIVAADDFQLLEGGVSGCPAVEWLRATEDGACTQCTQLTTCHRTSVKNILDAARCLRENIPATGETIPVFCCPNHGLAAFKIIEAMVYNARDWQGSTALICPSHDEFLQQVLASCDSQLQKKNRRPISWFHECAAREEREQLHDCLGLGNQDSYAKGWTAPTGDMVPAAAQVVARTQRFSRLRGIQDIPHDVVARHVDTVVHERRAYCGHSPKRIVTTVHGAKNREFDNVIILWPYKVPSDSEQKRRLLYNAITRSKLNCMLLVRGNLQRVKNDPVLSLLGPAKDAISSARRRKKPI